MYILLLAILIDLLLGDPDFIIHPVVIIGGLITRLENIIRGITGNDKYIGSNKASRLGGVVLVIIVIVCTYFFTWLIIKTAFMVNYYFGFAVNVWLLATTIAIKGLAGAGSAVYNHLSEGNLELARREVAKIVGRDTGKMEEGEVARAAVETVAENTSDGIIAPILFYFLAGTPLAMSYKAVNTLDSMLGYKDEKYEFFGWAAARLDDLVNYIPARLTGFGFCLASFITGRGFKNAYSVMKEDAGNHPSLNAGYPEGAVAGSLGIRLGGLNYYQGRPSFRAYLGEKTREIKSDDLRSVIKMMYWDILIIIPVIGIVKYIIFEYTANLL